MPRNLLAHEIEELLGQDVVARLATVDADGYPHVTPIWFAWEDDTLHMTSYATGPHVRRCLANPRIGLVVDAEDDIRADGERPNRQVRAIGHAIVLPDVDRRWTRRIHHRYSGDLVQARDRHPGRERVVIHLRPMMLTAVASV